jgi:hypothetical protein
MTKLHRIYLRGSVQEIHLQSNQSRRLTLARCGPSATRPCLAFQIRLCGGLRWWQLLG